jgi:hypothetical protein
MSDSSTAPSGSRPRHRLPILVGSLIGAAGLVLGGTFGGIAAASAHGHHHHSSSAPRLGSEIPNVTIVENEIKAYYGNVDKAVNKNKHPQLYKLTGGTEHIPSSHSNYAKQMRSIARHAESYLRYRTRHSLQHGAHRHWHHRAKRALVFDIDDTLMSTYNYEIADQFGYNPDHNATFVNAEAFPAAFGMPRLVHQATREGYTIFFITGRPGSQRKATVGNLRKDGYHVRAGKRRLFLKDHNSGKHLPNCGLSAKKNNPCTTIQYKSGIRKYIESQGYDIVGSFGDQYSDLKGGYADATFKLPNPMYYLP